MPKKLNRYSSRITEPKSQGASQAMLYGAGRFGAILWVKQKDVNRAARALGA